MDRTFETSADSSEFEDLPWEAYFDAVLPRTGSSETIPCSYVSSSHSLHNSEFIPFARNPSTVQDDEIIDSADTFNTLSSINYHPDSPKFDLLDSTDAFNAFSSTTEVHSHDLTSNSHSNHSTVDSTPNSHISVHQSVVTLLSPKKARKPLPQNEYATSPLRPHVPADRHLLLWTTPHTELAQSQLDQDLPHSLQKVVLSKLLKSVTDDTCTQYGAGLLRFTQFCDQNGIPEGRRMPASYVLLAGFIANASGSVSGKSIRNWLNGLRLWHILNNAEWNGKHKWISSLKRTADKEGVVFKKPLRNPITVEHLRALRRNLDLSIPMHAALWAVAVIAFWACRRLGKLLPKYGSNFNSILHVSRSTRIIFYTVNGRTVLSLHIPWTKTTGVQGFDLILTATDDDLCPVAAFSNHIAVNIITPSNVPNSIPLFAYRDKGEFITIDKVAFLAFTQCQLLLPDIRILILVLAVLASTDLESTQGHSY